VAFNIGPGVQCWDSPAPPEDQFILECNNIFGNGPGGQVVGDCGDVIGLNGNISVDPLFERTTWPYEPGSWCLSENSPLLLDPPPGCGLIGATDVCPPIGVGDAGPAPRRRLAAEPPRPNPFAERTAIAFYQPRPGEVEVQIYNVLGRRLRTLHAGWLPSGDHRLEWDGRWDSGERAASGAYVARIRAGGEELTRTLLLIR